MLEVSLERMTKTSGNEKDGKIKRYHKQRKSTGVFITEKNYGKKPITNSPLRIFCFAVSRLGPIGPRKTEGGTPPPAKCEFKSRKHNVARVGIILPLLRYNPVLNRVCSAFLIH